MSRLGAAARAAGRSLREGWLALAAVLALAVVIRLLPYRSMFVGGVLFPFSNDAAYHVRRILRLVEHFEYPGLFDPMFDWPRGAATHWSPGFDTVAAAVILALGGRHDPELTTRIAALLPVVYAGAGVFLVARLAMRLVPGKDAWVGACAGAFAALLPQNIVISHVGFVDHHVTEVLFTALLWTWTVSAVDLAERRASVRRRIVFEVSGALLVAGAVWVQSVGLLHVGTAVVALAVMRLVRRPARDLVPRSWLGTGAPALGAGALLLFALYLPAVHEHGHAYAYEFPTYLQPSLLALGGLALGTCDVVVRELRRADVGAAVARLRASAAAAGAVVLAMLLLAPSPARVALSQLLDFAATKGEDLAKIDELMPLFADRGGSRWDLVDAAFGGTGRALVVLLPLGVFAAGRAGTERFAAVVVWTGALLALSLLQNRWTRTLVVPAAVVSALALRELAARVASRISPQMGSAGASTFARERAAGPFAFAAACLLLLAPDPVAAMSPPPHRATEAPLEAGLFLRARALPSEHGRPRGILAPWHLGFELLYASGLPTLSTGHAWLVGEEGYRLERSAWSGTKEALWSLMDSRGLGFVVAGVSTMAGVTMPSGKISLITEQGTIDWDHMKTLPLGPLLIGGSGIPELGIRHLEHLCPRFVSSEFMALDPPLPRLWVFERVEGALLEGHAEPKSTVVAEVRLRHAGWTVSYFASADAGEDGAFSIRFPVPTHMAAPSLQSGRVLRISRKGAPVVQLDVPEAAVLAGTLIPVPPPPADTR